MKHTGDYELDTINMLEQECSDLEEENNRLEEENKTLKEKQKTLDKENCKLIDENVKLKKWIYQNVHWWLRIDYQEFCKKNWI